MVVAIMKGYIIFVIILMLLYTARHFYFTIVRLLGRQRLYYNDGKTSTGHAGYNRTSGRGGSRNLKACRHEDG